MDPLPFEGRVFEEERLAASCRIAWLLRMRRQLSPATHPLKALEEIPRVELSGDLAGRPRRLTTGQGAMMGGRTRVRFRPP